MNTRYRILLAAAVGMLVMSASAVAQADYTVDVPTPNRMLDTGGFTTFEFTVRNPSSRTISVQVHRVVNELPSSNWHSSICSFTTCYPEETSDIPAIEVKPGDTTGYTVHVTAGNVYGQTGRVVLRFDEGGTDALEREVTVKTAEPPVQLFRVEPESINAAVLNTDTAQFTIWSYNETSDPMTMTVHRVENYFPDTTWSSSICIERDCYEPSTASPPPTVVDGNKAILYKLKVTGKTAGTGRVVLRFKSDRQADPIEKRFNVTIGVAGLSIEKESSANRVVVAEDGSLRLSLDAIVGGNVSVRLYDITGREVADYSRQVSGAVGRGARTATLDTSPLGPGSYIYQIISKNVRSGGRIHITR